MDDLKSIRNICRVCLGRPENCEMLFLNATLMEKIIYIGGSAEVDKVEELPQFICLHCEAELDFVYGFIAKLNLSKLQIQEFLHNFIDKEAPVPNTSYTESFQITDLSLEPIDITEGYGTENDAEDNTEFNIEIVKMEKSPLPCESPLRGESDSENPLIIDEGKPSNYVLEGVGQIHLVPESILKQKPNVDTRLIERKTKPGPKSKTKMNLGSKLKLESKSKPKMHSKSKFESSSNIVSHISVKSEPGENLNVKQICKSESNRNSGPSLDILPPFYIPPTDGEHICYLCQKQFSTRANMLRHVREHMGRRFVCDYENCNSFFTQRSSLQVHTARHKGLKPFSCDICSKKFSQSKSLVFHMRIHTGESPYVCDYCDKSFKQKSNLIRHFKSHRKPKPLRRMHFQCHKCQKSLASKQSLIRHLVLHERPDPYMIVNKVEEIIL